MGSPDVPGHDPVTVSVSRAWLAMIERMLGDHHDRGMQGECEECGFEWLDITEPDDWGSL